MVFTYINTLDKSSSPAIYSFDFGGLHEPAFVTGDQFDWDCGRAWDTMRVFYLTQPGGGQFKMDHTTQNPGSYRYTIDSAGTLALSYFDIERESGQGSGISLRWVANGAVTIFGCYGFRRDEVGGIRISRGAYGGFKMSEYAGLDNAFQAEWFSQLAPDLYILNGGMNDRGTDDCLTYLANVNTFLANLNASCDILLVAPNSTSDEGSTFLGEYRDQLYSWQKSVIMDS